VSVERKFKMALDETRLLMLGSQILFGFEFEVVFQQGFDGLPKLSQWLDAIALLLMAIAIALLIAPGTQHRLVYDGQITARLQHVATVFAGWALLPFALSLGLDLYISLEHGFGPTIAAGAGAFFALLALFLWYGLEFAYRRFVWDGKNMGESEPERTTSLQVKIDQMLTEARIVIPGAQALLGFQLLVILNRVFAELPKSSQVVHGLALGSIAFALLLLVAPAAFHRLAFRGEDAMPVFRFGSRFVTAALLPLALGISGDIYVAVTRIAASTTIGAAAGASAMLLFLTFWYAQPLILRTQRSS
jgi:Family of unknown function (DUF6328)